LFYEVFDKHFQKIIPFWAIKYKMSIKNVIKQPGPVGSGAADRPQETLYRSVPKMHFIPFFNTVNLGEREP
jgi:hypothetical protein